MNRTASKGGASSPEIEHKLTRIRDRKCALCQYNLNELIEASQKQKVPFPKKCPGCQAIFLTTTMYETLWECGNCHTRLADAKPDIEVFCRHCGCILIYPEELRSQTQGAD